MKDLPTLTFEHLSYLSSHLSQKATSEAESVMHGLHIDVICRNSTNVASERFLCILRDDRRINANILLQLDNDNAEPTPHG